MHLSDEENCFEPSGSKKGIKLRKMKESAMPQDPHFIQNCTCNLEYLKEGYYIENEKNSISFYSS